MSAARPQSRDPLRTEQWPPERFYWSTIDAPARCRPGPLPPGLLAEATDDMPVDADLLHAVGALDPHGRVVVCAAPIEALQQLGPDVISLTPSALPPGIDIDRTSLELLVGRCEPMALRRVRTRAHLRLAGTLVTCVLLISLGLARRAAHDDSLAARCIAARTSLLTEIYLPEDQLERIIAHRMSLAEAQDQSPSDAVPTLATVLTAWPSSAESSVESLTVTPDRILASISLTSDPGPFLQSFALPASWRLDEPRLSTVRGLTHLGLQIRTEPSP